MTAYNAQVKFHPSVSYNPDLLRRTLKYDQAAVILRSRHYTLSSELVYHRVAHRWPMPTKLQLYAFCRRHDSFVLIDRVECIDYGLRACTKCYPS